MSSATRKPDRSPSKPAPPAPAGADLLVAELYRGLLGREPDEAGLRDHVTALDTGVSLGQLARAFVESPEFVTKSGAGPATDRYIRVDRDPPMPIALDYTAAQIDQLWAHIASTWESLGDDDPYWSVLSDPRFRLPNMTDAAVLQAFYESGSGDIARLEAWLARNQIALRPDMVCAEYGCGVGRVSGWLARRVNRLRAFDISSTHLARAESWMAKQDADHVAFQLVRSPADLDQLTGIDLFFSVIVLQHNPPPIMALILGRAFAHLRPGGIAYFQVPTYRRNYAFSLEDYLAGIGGPGHIEMHCLPQAAVFRLAAENGLVPLEVQQDGLAGEVGTSHTFLMQKI